MSIVESARPSHSTRITRLQALTGATLVSTAIFVAAPRVARADLVYVGTGDQNWFKTTNWAYGTVTGSLPESVVVATQAATNIDAPNVSMPAVGVLFDPANQGKTAAYVANIDKQQNSFYVSSASGSFDGSTGYPNKLTIESGTLLVSHTTLGRDDEGIIVQKAGSWIGDGSLKIGGTVKTSMGSGTYEYHGGNFTQNNQVQIGAGTNGNNPGSASAAVGKFVIYNDGPDGCLLVTNGCVIAPNATNAGSIGIAEFHYDLNTHGVGLTRPIQNTGFNASLSIKNQDFTGGLGGESSRLVLVLDAAPTLINGGPQNLGLFKEAAAIGGNGTYPKAFYSLDGSTLFSQGATVIATYGNKLYSWTISYSGLITFTDSSTSAYGTANIAAIGGNDVVLIGVPEPGSLALLGGAGSLILARRRAAKKGISTFVGQC